MAFETEDKEM